MGTAIPEVEVIDRDIGDIEFPVSEQVVVNGDGSTALVPYKPTTLLDYSALMVAARAHPRDPILAGKQALAICTLDETTAKACFYALPRAGRQISGPGIGMAETLAFTFGNMNVTTDDITIKKEEGVVELRGFIMDTQTGLTHSAIVRRRIRYSDDHKKYPGQIYDEDMIETTIAAGSSILYRTLVLRIIPRPFVAKILEAALAVSAGGKSFGDRQNNCVAHWEKTYKIPKAKLLLHLQLVEVADLSILNFEYLLGLEQAMKLGDIKLENIFKRDIAPPEPGQKPENLGQVKADLQAKAQGDPQAPAPPETTPQPPQPETPAPVVEPTPETPVAPPVAPAPAEVPPEPLKAPTPAPEAPKEPELPPAPVQEPETAQIEMPGDSPPAPVDKPPGAPIQRPPGGPAKKV
ncbi:hypothetical protein LCGC14_1425810 [marine sediment metagenome]|uniref:Uncharacterized protein n=1 Tax=marine sediment metagenome TaxID=412755 RepID=A0A0F9JPZ3_9ZZZZ